MRLLLLLLLCHHHLLEVHHQDPISFSVPLGNREREEADILYILAGMSKCCSYKNTTHTEWTKGNGGQEDRRSPGGEHGDAQISGRKTRRSLLLLFDGGGEEGNGRKSNRFMLFHVSQEQRAAILNHLICRLRDSIQFASEGRRWEPGPSSTASD